MTNDQKAARLDILAAEMEHADNGAADAALLRECASLLWEREAVQWQHVGNDEYQAIYKNRTLSVSPRGWIAYIASLSSIAHGISMDISAAQAAAVAWCDSQEGK